MAVTWRHYLCPHPDPLPLQSVPYNPIVMYYYLLGSPISQLHTFKSGNWVRTGWMNKLWVSFPLSLVYALGQQGLVSPHHDSGAVPVIRGHGTPRGSSGTPDKDLICKGHFLEGWRRNTEVFVDTSSLARLGIWRIFPCKHICRLWSQVWRNTQFCKIKPFLGRCAQFEKISVYKLA